MTRTLMLRTIVFIAGAAAAGPLLAARPNPAAAPASSPSGDVTTAADNTRVNKRDRDADTTTPGDQPNDKADIDLAATARKAIEHDDSLSTMAHNVKLVAADGVVTLRGPVANANEKAEIGSVVRHVAGVRRVDNQLDVKAQ